MDYSNKRKIFAVMDCNNFFVSCERAFNPKIRNKPVGVLSNNDGCIVARSNELKELGIPMGAPAFKYKYIFERYNVVLLSSNYSLYGDMSDRVMKVLKKYADDVEIYSIDEAFIDLTNLQSNSHIDDYIKMLKKRIERDTGISISIGVASTKTLAKAANAVAKKNPLYGGIMNLANKSEDEIDSLLKTLDVSDIWGIGRGLKQFFYGVGIQSAYDLKYTDSSWIRNTKSVLAQRTILELQGISCIPIKTSVKIRKSIISSRSFGRQVTDLNDLEEAISQYASRACSKLRQQNLVAEEVSVYLLTNRHKPNEPQYNSSLSIKLDEASDYTPTITNTARTLLKKIYKKGYIYKKAGIVLSSITKKDSLQKNLILNNSMDIDLKHSRLMNFTDMINKKWGINGIKLASEGIKKSWKMKNEMRSKRFTTSWHELLEIRVS